MNIQCESCGSEHELDPPAWVLSSGRPFRFRCSVCGHSQMADPPTTIGLPDTASHEPPEPRHRTPTPVGVPRTAPATAPVATAETPSNDTSSVFLKQEGKVYLVKDWATLQRWIMERRVGREDLVSDGGVRWEPIGSRPELGSFFAAVEQLEAAELAGLRGGETPFPSDDEQWGEESVVSSGPQSGLARLDDETEGVPLGLPPLPTEDLEGEDEEAWPEQPPSRLSSATPAPEEPASDAPDDAPAVTDDPPASAEASESPEEPSAGDVVESPPSMPFFAESEFLGAPVEAKAPDVEAEVEPSLADEDEPAPALLVEDDEDMVSLADEGADDAMPLDDGTLAEEDDEPMVSVEDQALADTSSDELDEADAPDEDLEFGEPGMPAEEDPVLGAVPFAADVPTGADPVESPTEVPPEPRSEAPDDEVQDTDEFDIHDPFRDFSDMGTDQGERDIVVKKGPSNGWLLAAAAVVTVLVLLLLFTGYNKGWFGGGPDAPADTALPVNTTPDPDPDPPALPPEPAADTDEVADSDTDAADADPADTDGAADTDSADTDGATDADPTPETAVVDADPTPATPPAPTPDPDPPPTRTPRPAASPSLAQLRERGWAAMEGGRIQGAIETFERAVAQSPGDAEANYGLGYALLQASQPQRARGPLCVAQKNGNTSIKRDVTGFLERNSLSCP